MLELDKDTSHGEDKEWISWIGPKSQKISVLYPWSKLKTITKLPMKPENRQLLKISSALRLQVLTKLTQVVGWLSKARSGLYLSIQFKLAIQINQIKKESKV